MSDKDLIEEAQPTFRNGENCMKKVQTKSSRFSWLGSATSLLAVAVCYGTLAGVLLLSVIGISVDIKEAFLVKLITALLILALAGMFYSYRLHRRTGPLLLSFFSAAVLIWVFYGVYSGTLETTGFAGLVAASVWDLRIKKLSCTAKCKK